MNEVGKRRQRVVELIQCDYVVVTRITNRKNMSLPLPCNQESKIYGFAEISHLS